MFPDHVFQDFAFGSITADDEVGFGEAFANFWDDINKQIDSFAEGESADHDDVDGVGGVSFGWVWLKLRTVNSVRDDGDDVGVKRSSQGEVFLAGVGD